MNKADLFMELVATYRKHGWELTGALLQPTTHAELSVKEPDLLSPLVLKEASFDALWFSRPSHNRRVAWELRLLAETQYALFETFEADESEEQREEMRLEMEARLREYVHGSCSERGH
jgi:S-formylglutathione hydrolase FrmB